MEKNSRTAGENAMGVGIAIGVSLGVAFGVVMDNLAMGIALGVSIGVAIGAGMMKKARTHAAADSDPAPATGDER